MPPCLPRSALRAPLKMMNSYVSLLGGTWGPFARRPSVPKERTASQSQGRQGVHTWHRAVSEALGAPWQAGQGAIKMPLTALQRDAALVHVDGVQNALISNATFRYEADLAANVGQIHARRSTALDSSGAGGCEVAGVSGVDGRQGTTV